MSRSFVSSFRLGLVCFALLACFFGLMGRLFQLHVIEAGRFTELVRESRQRLETREAPRGQILDRNGNLLATSRTVYTVGLDPHVYEAPEPARLAALCRLLALPPEAIEAAAGKRYRPAGSASAPPRKVRWAKLAERVDMDTYAAIEELGIKGVYGNRKYVRHYPDGPLAAHILGFVNKEGVAASGIEAHLDYYLTGQDGWEEGERDGRRRDLPQFRQRVVPARPGYDVELTIDSFIQHTCELEVARLVKEYQPEGVTVVVSEADTGALLALANYPSFDPNEFWEFETADLTNRASTHVFEPGSTFKVVTAAAALEEGAAGPEALFNCTRPRASYRGRQLSLPADHHPMGKLTLAEVVVQSSNRGAAQVGMRVGGQALYDYARAFGFGTRTGFPLAGESPGILHKPADWDGLTITRLPIGYAVSANALQVHYATSVIANGGVLMEPMLVRRVLTPEGAEAVTYQPRARRRVVSPETAYTLTRILARVPTDEGTAAAAGLEGFAVAGKTGTTQKIVNGAYSQSHHIASFTGFFPADAPRLVISVFVDEPRAGGVGYGGRVAAPAFHNIAKALTQYLDIRPTLSGEALLAWKGKDTP